MDRARLQLAVQHHQAGQLREAHQLYGEILRAEPNNTHALRYLGLLAQQLGQHEQAVELIEKAHKHGRPDPQSLNTLGMAHAGAGRMREAKRWFSKALSLKADHADAHGNLGSALRALGQAKEAEASYRRALALEPSPQTHYNLGNLLVELGRSAEAEEQLRTAIALHPAYAEAHNNLAHLLALSGRLEEAEDSYRAALASQPQQFESRLSLGNVLHRLGRFEEAVACHEEALVLKPDSVAAHYNLGNTLASLDRWQQASTAYTKAIELDPGFGAARWALTMAQLPSVYETQPEFGERRAAFAHHLETLGRWVEANPGASGPDILVQQPFHLAYQEDDNRELLKEYGELCAVVMERWRVVHKLPDTAAPRHGRVRLGIASSHLHGHSVWHAIVKGWLQHLDPSRVEVHLFHLGLQKDAETELARKQCAELVEGPRSPREWARTILERQLDVLAFPEVGMNSTTAQLASLRLAPVQLAAWGHPETTGLPTIDHYISADAFEPSDADRHYSERLLRLPNLGCFYQPYGTAPAETTVVPAGGPIFLCCGTPFKYPPRYDNLLISIARQLPDCRFVFFQDQALPAHAKLRRRLQSSFAAAGLQFERHVIFVPWQMQPAFYGLLRRAHAMLDTVGFSGFNTTMQAVECGTPIVAMEGRFMRGRFASGILKRLDLEELVARSDTAYVELAVKLARDAGYRSHIRGAIERSREKLYGDEAPVRAFEEFLVATAGTRSSS